jgi:hypothetical protein
MNRKVRALATTHAAIEIMRRETTIPTQSITTALQAWSKGRDLLKPGDVVFVVAAESLDMDQANTLLETVIRQDAVLRVFGDGEPRPGSAYALMLRAFEDAQRPVSEP